MSLIPNKRTNKHAGEKTIEEISPYFASEEEWKIASEIYWTGYVYGIGRDNKLNGSLLEHTHYKKSADKYKLTIYKAKKLADQYKKFLNKPIERK